MADEKYLEDPETGERFRLGGCLISDEPSDLPPFGASRALGNKELPPSVDLRQFMTPVEQQGQLNSCVANALAGAYEFLIMKNKKKHIDVSRLFMYYNSRKKDGYHTHTMADNGTYIRHAIQALKEFGCCKEVSYPYNAALVNQPPPPPCYSEAKDHCISEALSIPTDLNEMRACLAEGYPFAFGLKLFQSFLQAGANGGRVPMPNVQYESQSTVHGWHAMLAVGYSDASQCFLVRNSWGEKWGDKGYCYIHYPYMCNPELCRDIHTVKTIDDVTRPRRDTKHENILNPYDWNVHKDKRFYIPENYKHLDFDYTFFWKFNDSFNYFNSIWQHGQIKPFFWKTSQSKPIGDESHHTVSPKNESKMSFILWIDQKIDENNFVEKQLTSDKRIKIDFCETLSKGEDHLLRHINQIKSPSSTFQIICRGYYRHENKNPLDLLHFLDKHRLSHIPVLVFTQDKSGVQHHLQQQAASTHIHDWKQRLFITNNSEELIKQSKENIAKKRSRSNH